MGSLIKGLMRKGSGPLWGRGSPSLGPPLSLAGGSQLLVFDSWADSGPVWARGRSPGQLLHQLLALFLTPGKLATSVFPVIFLEEAFGPVNPAPERGSNDMSEEWGWLSRVGPTLQLGRMGGTLDLAQRDSSRRVEFEDCSFFSVLLLSSVLASQPLQQLPYLVHAFDTHKSYLPCQGTGPRFLLYKVGVDWGEDLSIH